MGNNLIEIVNYNSSSWVRQSLMKTPFVCYQQGGSIGFSAFIASFDSACGRSPGGCSTGISDLEASFDVPVKGHQ